MRCDRAGRREKRPTSVPQDSDDFLPWQEDETDNADGARSRGRRRYPKKRSTGRIVLLTSVSVLLVVVLGIAAAGWLVVNNIAGDVERIPKVFEDIPEESRPTKPPEGEDSINILLAGLDGENSTENESGSRSDAVMVLHVDGDRENAYLVSIPRDSWVSIPGQGENKVNAAYSLGGPSLYVQTIEELTGLSIDHLAVIDWSGFRGLTDALGGVELDFDEEVQAAEGQTFPAGENTLSGEEALQYVRERKDLPGGDFDRVKRQQNYLRALMQQTLSSDTLSSPGKMLDVANSITDATKVDDQLTTNGIIQMGVSMRGIRGDDVEFLTVPTDGTGTVGDASVVNYDHENAERLWDAMAKDSAEQFIADNPDLVTGEEVR